MASGSGNGFVKVLSTFVLAVLVIVLVNEVAQYGIAWTKLMLAARDTKTVLAQTIKASPGDREASASAAAAACAKHGVTLLTYGHDPAETAMGARVNASLQMSIPVPWALASSMIKATMADGTPLTFRNHVPTVTSGYGQQFDATP